MDLTQKLLGLSDLYCEARGVSPATLSGIVFRDSRTLARIRGDGSLTVRKYEHAIRWLSEHWPDQAEWPKSVDRPHVVSALRSDAAA